MKRWGNPTSAIGVKLDQAVRFHHLSPHLGNRQGTIPASPTVAQPAPLAYDYFRGWNCRRVRLRHGVGKFGDKFRKARERQGIKLEDVSNSTKIGSRMLRAIEEEDFDQLPGGVFNKGFVRAYAKYLGLDEEETITGYVAALNQFNSQGLGPENPAPQPPATEHSPAQRTSSQSSSGQSSSSQAGSAQRSSGQAGERRQVVDRRNDPLRRASDSRASGLRANDRQDIELPNLQLPKAEHVRPRRRMAVHSDLDRSRWRLPALIVLLIVAGAFWWSHSRNAHANGANPVPASVSSSSTAPAPTLVNRAPASGSDASRTAAVSSHLSSSVRAAAKATAHPGSPPASSSSTSSQSPATTSAANASSAREEAKQPDADAASPPPHRPVANLTLVIRASENSWIAVIADGQPAVHETLIAPAHTLVRAAREIVVRAGNAAGVSFALNGQEFPSQGAEGEVKTVIFDSTGLRPAASPAPTPAAPAPTTPPADPSR
jgi:cytoskeletal protein RodZ